jgi:hypothetical protein
MNQLLFMVARLAAWGFTIKADAFIVMIERAKSSPLMRQPGFMHM